jgi:hypothetical protein
MDKLSLVVFVLLFAAAIVSAQGFLCAWVLRYFGLHIPFYVCGVGLALLETTLGAAVRK